MTLVIPELPREFVVNAQRRRAVDAVAEIAHEFGLQAITIQAVCRLARMARVTYYSLFESSSGCLRYSFAAAYGEVVGPVAAAHAETDWPAAIEAATERLYAGVARQPLLAELCLVHCHGAAEEAAGHDFEAAVDSFAAMLRAGRAQEGRRPRPLADEYLARTIVSRAASRALRGEADQLAADSRTMSSLIATACPALAGEAKRA